MDFCWQVAADLIDLPNFSVELRQAIGKMGMPVVRKLELRSEKQDKKVFANARRAEKVSAKFA